MKNFYESTDIKSQLTLDVSLTLTPVEQCYCIVTINGVELFSGILKRTTKLDYTSPLEDPLNFKIAVERRHPQAVIVDNITVNNHSIMPLYQHFASPSTNYIDFNGDWTLNIPSFYTWYHTATGQGWIV